MNNTWRALSREGALAAEHIAIGVTALSRANYAQHAYYGQAFFALSIGFGRAAKLILIVDHAVENHGAFPPHTLLRHYGHDLRALLLAADQVALRRGVTGLGDRLPQSSVHDGIIKVLTDFAENLTRYYNLSIVTGDPRAQQILDPVHAWFEEVVRPILALHYTPAIRKRHEANARIVASMLSGHATVQHHSESGDQITTVEDASFRTGVTEFAVPFARMNVLQIARFLARLLSELGRAGYGLGVPLIPEFIEIFGLFLNEDKVLKKKKTWSIYP